MQSAGFEWDPTERGYPRWIHRAKDVYCVRGPNLTDEGWRQIKERGIFESQLDKPPSFFAQLGQPCMSRWSYHEIERVCLAYVQALANDGDAWKSISREQAYELLTEKQKILFHSVLAFDHYDRAFQTVRETITSSDGAFSVGGFWNRSRA